MSARAKFLFDVDFARGDPAEQKEPTITVSAHRAAVADAEARAYDSGFAAATTEARAEAERRIGAALDNLVGALHSVEGRLEAEAVEVAVAVARKLAPELVAREPLTELAALASGCFRQLIGTPHVVVRVNDALYDDIRTRLEQIAHTHGFDGRLIVLGEATIASGDCRIEWADGGVVRDTAMTTNAIAEAVERYITARRPAAPAT